MASAFAAAEDAPESARAAEGRRAAAEASRAVVRKERKGARPRRRREVEGVGVILSMFGGGEWEKEKGKGDK